MTEKIVTRWLRKHKLNAIALGRTIFVCSPGFWRKIRLKVAASMLPEETVVVFLPPLKEPTGRFLRAFREDELRDWGKMIEGLKIENQKETQEPLHRPSIYHSRKEHD